MNRKIVINIIGKILMIEALVMVIPLLVSFIYHEDPIYKKSLAFVIILELIFAFIMTRPKIENDRLYTSEGAIIVSLSWILLTVFAALPFVLSGAIPSFIDAFFEMSSGLTTTGASILSDVEALPRSLLFLRSFTHFIGGMGVLVFAFALLPEAKSNSVYIMKAEVPGPNFGKVRSRISDSARVLYLIYIAMTVLVIIFLLLGGLPLFDSTLLAVGAAGTGGFAILNGSIAPYDSLYIEIVLGLAMVLFGVNFNLYYWALLREFEPIKKSDELKLYLAIILAAVLLITLNLGFNGYGFARALRDSGFTVSSLISTTGYSTADFGKWPLFSHIIILIIMFTGGMAGSTAGGLKISRIGIILKSVNSQFKKTKSPNRLVTTKYEGKALTNEYLLSVLNYLALYIIIFIIVLLVVSTEAPDFISAFSTVLATFNNIGPGLGKLGPMFNFSTYSPLVKLLLSFVMIMGRLELFPILILLSPNTYRSK